MKISVYLRLLDYYTAAPLRTAASICIATNADGEKWLNCAN